MKTVNFIKNKPIARFFYTGTHNQEIKRVILIKEIKKDKVLGYELSSDKKDIVENLENAPIKSYLKSKMKKNGKKILLERFSISDLINKIV